MKYRPRAEEQDDPLCPRLVDMIDQRHELVKLAALIDWEVFDREWSGFFSSGKGRFAASGEAALSPACLQAVGRGGGRPLGREPLLPVLHQRDLLPAPSAHRPIFVDPLAGRIGEEGVEWLLTQTIRAGQKSEVIDEDGVWRWTRP